MEATAPQLTQAPAVRILFRGASVMNSIIYLVGLVVVVMAILSFLGLH
jgi:hypothetical protein